MLRLCFSLLITLVILTPKVFSPHIVEIQTHMTKRAIELLALPNDNVSRLLLDIGCGSGLSGEVITEMGHNWIGVDISEAMLSGS